MQFETRFWENHLESWFPHCLHFHGAISLFMFALDVSCNVVMLFTFCCRMWISWTVSSHNYPLTNACIMVSFSVLVYWLHTFIVSCVDLHCYNTFNELINQSFQLFLSHFSPWFISFKTFLFSLVSLPSNHSLCSHFLSCLDTYSSSLLSFFADLVVCSSLPLLLGSKLCHAWMNAFHSFLFAWENCD